jgi:predicted nucleotidyltransferase
MPSDKFRRQIAFEAARLMYDRQETEYFRAKLRAAKRICRGWVKPKDLPSNREIRDQIQQFARLHEGDNRTAHLQEMRIAALVLMRLLRAFRPRLHGSTLTGHVRAGSDIDLHLFTDSLSAVELALEEADVPFDVEHKRVRKDGEERLYTHIHIHDRFTYDLTLYRDDQAHEIFRSSITGQPIERAGIVELEQLIANEYPDVDLDEAAVPMEQRVDRFHVYRTLLIPLEAVTGRPEWHPEGDALYHSLQVFELARNELPYDEEFLLAALLHDVGKAIDPYDHVATGLEALDGYITPRTAWLIEHHMEGHALFDGTIGIRARHRLEESPDYDELVLLSRCDRRGRVAGAQAPDVDDALDYLKDLARNCG